MSLFLYSRPQFGMESGKGKGTDAGGKGKLLAGHRGHMLYVALWCVCGCAPRDEADPAEGQEILCAEAENHLELHLIDQMGRLHYTESWPPFKPGNSMVLKFTLLFPPPTHYASHIPLSKFCPSGLS